MNKYQKSALGRSSEKAKTVQTAQRPRLIPIMRLVLSIIPALMIRIRLDTAENITIP